jgi:subtilisin family serine protease
MPGDTGRGVTAGIVDSGIDATNPEFAGRISAASADLAGRRGIQDEGGHGTAVAAVFGAARNDAGPLGIAYGSTLLVLRTDDAGTCVSEGGCKHSENGIARAIDVAIQNRARVINISLGGDAGGSAFVAAINRATAAGTIVVISAGNDGKPDPTGSRWLPTTRRCRAGWSSSPARRGCRESSRASPTGPASGATII